MGFKKNSIVFRVFGLASKLPYFSIDTLSSLGVYRQGLKILLNRLIKRGEIISLKRGLYAARPYIDDLQKKGLYTRYLEFIGAILSKPSYLSLEYVLSEHNLLTELSWSFTFITRNKTNRFTNEFGTFAYRHICERLYCGFKTSRFGGFTINKATPAKALFDFLYLRKNSLIDPKSVEELRLNIDALRGTDIKELKRYVVMEGSARMRAIFDHVIK